jgi:hypothetical protein
MTCATCGGLLIVEPALVRCHSCGRESRRPGATARDRRRQHAIDQNFLRPGDVAGILEALLAELKRRVRKMQTGSGALETGHTDSRPRP